MQTVYVGRAQLYLFVEETHQYTEYGSVGTCIVGSPQTLLYKLGCYSDSGEYHCTATIHANNEVGARVALQGGGYVSFKDENGKAWSMLFASEDDAIEFLANVTVAMYSASGNPDGSIIVCDAAVGKKDRAIFANDKIKVRFRSWVVQRGTPGTTASKLGSALESNESDEKPHMLTVPVNHVSVTPDMKGFEGMLVGAFEEGQRFMVIPQNAKRGGGPSTHMCFFVKILKKKDEPRGGQQSATSFQQQQQPGVYPNTGLYGGQQQGLGWQQQQFAPGPYLQLAAGPQSTALQAYEAPAPAPPVVVQGPPPPPPGFNGDQLMIVDRMRDQIQALTAQLKDATQKFDLLWHDFKVHQNKTKPTSLASAQIEYTVQKLIQDTDDLKEELSQRDITLKQVEDKNRELQRKVDRFTATANQLAEEKKSAITMGSEEKLDLDRRIAQLQGQLTRIQGEREDVARHLSTTKRLLEISDQDLKGEKGKFQVALVTFQTNESKMAACEESLIEERSRRKLLESKCAVLGDELRSVTESLRVKDGQMDERRRKMEADKLHYSQILEDERAQAAVELRDLRQELIDELAIRDRRYQEERQRVAHESFERGRAQGVDDGHSEALLEADQRIQELVLSVQRSKSEVETMKIRLRQSREQSDSDQRRLNAQISALQRTVDDLDAQNSASAIEMDSLRNAKTTVESDAFDNIAASLRGLSRPIGKRDLLTVLHSLRVNKTVDYSFEVSRDEEEAERMADDRRRVTQWVAAVIDVNPSATFPSMILKAAEEKMLPFSGEALPSSSPSGPVTELSAEVVDMIAQSESIKREAVQFDPEAMQKRYRELLAEIDGSNPELMLIEKKPPRPPTPPREPTPPRAPTPPAPQPVPQSQPVPNANEVQATVAHPPEPEVETPPQSEDQPTLVSAPVSTGTNSTAAPVVSHEAPQALPSLSSDDDSDGEAPTHNEPTPQTAATSHSAVIAAPAAPDSDDDAPKPSAKTSVAKSIPVVAAAADGDDDPAPPPKPAAKSAFGRPLPKPREDSDDDDEAPAAPSKPQAKAASPAAKKSAMFADSGSDDDAPPAATKPVAPPKRTAAAAVTTAAPRKTFDGSDSDTAVKPAPKTSASKAPVSKPAAKKSMFADSSDDEPVSKSAAAKRPAAKAALAPAKKPAPKKKSMFDDSDDD